MQTKSGGYAIITKNAPGGVTIAGYASTFGGPPDLGGDVIERGAYAGSLRNRPAVPILWAHDPAQPIGKTLHLSETEKGLIFEAVILPTTTGKDAAILAKAGIMSCSIGYDTLKSGPPMGKGEVRRLKEIDLYEISLVTFPMNPKAQLLTVGDALADELTIAKADDRRRRGLPVSDADMVKACQAEARIIDKALQADRRRALYDVEFELQELAKMQSSPEPPRTRARQSGRAR
mgnify:CR=1 FL=1